MATSQTAKILYDNLNGRRLLTFIVDNVCTLMYLKSTGDAAFATLAELDAMTQDESSRVLVYNESTSGLETVASAMYATVSSTPLGVGLYSLVGVRTTPNPNPSLFSTTSTGSSNTIYLQTTIPNTGDSAPTFLFLVLADRETGSAILSTSPTQTPTGAQTSVLLKLNSKIPPNMSVLDANNTCSTDPAALITYLVGNISTVFDKLCFVTTSNNGTNNGTNKSKTKGADWDITKSPLFVPLLATAVVVVVLCVVIGCAVGLTKKKQRNLY